MQNIIQVDSEQLPEPLLWQLVRQANTVALAKNKVPLGKLITQKHTIKVNSNLSTEYVITEKQNVTENLKVFGSDEDKSSNTVSFVVDLDSGEKIPLPNYNLQSDLITLNVNNTKIKYKSNENSDASSAENTNNSADISSGKFKIRNTLTTANTAKKETVYMDDNYPQFLNCSLPYSKIMLTNKEQQQQMADDGLDREKVRQFYSGIDLKYCSTNSNVTEPPQIIIIHKTNLIKNHLQSSESAEKIMNDFSEKPIFQNNNNTSYQSKPCPTNAQTQCENDKEAEFKNMNHMDIIKNIYKKINKLEQTLTDTLYPLKNDSKGFIKNTSVDKKMNTSQTTYDQTYNVCLLNTNVTNNNQYQNLGINLESLSNYCESSVRDTENLNKSCKLDCPKGILKNLKNKISSLDKILKVVTERSENFKLDCSHDALLSEVRKEILSQKTTDSVIPNVTRDTKELNDNLSCNHSEKELGCLDYDFIRAGNESYNDTIVDKQNDETYRYETDAIKIMQSKINDLEQKYNLIATMQTKHKVNKKPDLIKANSIGGKHKPKKSPHCDETLQNPYAFSNKYHSSIAQPETHLNESSSEAEITHTYCIDEMDENYSLNHAAKTKKDCTDATCSCKLKEFCQHFETQTEDKCCGNFTCFANTGVNVNTFRAETEGQETKSHRKSTTEWTKTTTTKQSSSLSSGSARTPNKQSVSSVHTSTFSKREKSETSRPKKSENDEIVQSRKQSEGFEPNPNINLPRKPLYSDNTDNSSNSKASEKFDYLKDKYARKPSKLESPVSIEGYTPRHSPGVIYYPLPPNRKPLSSSETILVESDSDPKLANSKDVTQPDIKDETRATPETDKSPTKKANKSTQCGSQRLSARLFYSLPTKRKPSDTFPTPADSSSGPTKQKATQCSLGSLFSTKSKSSKSSKKSASKKRTVDAVPPKGKASRCSLASLCSTKSKASKPSKKSVSTKNSSDDLNLPPKKKGSGCSLASLCSTKSKSSKPSKKSVRSTKSLDEFNSVPTRDKSAQCSLNSLFYENSKSSQSSITSVENTKYIDAATQCNIQFEENSNFTDDNEDENLDLNPTIASENNEQFHKIDAATSKDLLDFDDNPVPFKSNSDNTMKHLAEDNPEIDLKLDTENTEEHNDDVDEKPENSDHDAKDNISEKSILHVSKKSVEFDDNVEVNPETPEEEIDHTNIKPSHSNDGAKMGCKSMLQNVAHTIAAFNQAQPITEDIIGAIRDLEEKIKTFENIYVAPIKDLHKKIKVSEFICPPNCNAKESKDASQSTCNDVTSKDFNMTQCSQTPQIIILNKCVPTMDLVTVSHACDCNIISKDSRVTQCKSSQTPQKVILDKCVRTMDLETVSRACDCDIENSKQHELMTQVSQELQHQFKELKSLKDLLKSQLSLVMENQEGTISGILNAMESSSKQIIPDTAASKKPCKCEKLEPVLIEHMCPTSKKFTKINESQVTLKLKEPKCNKQQSKTSIKNLWTRKKSSSTPGSLKDVTKARQCSTRKTKSEIACPAVHSLKNKSENSLKVTNKQKGNVKKPSNFSKDASDITDLQQKIKKNSNADIKKSPEHPENTTGICNPTKCQQIPKKKNGLVLLLYKLCCYK